MIYTDKIYGRYEIAEPVLLDLCTSTAMQRLQGVLQHGITGLIGVTEATTRFEHSMGVMLLVRRLGATLEEQIAALLHDISHTAFSHVIDYVFNDHDQQGYHERHKEAFMFASDLPDVLACHGYDWRDFLHEEQFGLLEQDAPALCADRLDYFLRDSIDLGLAQQAEVQNALNHLVVYNGRIVCDDLAAARWMAYTFIQADEASWANFREVGLYELAAGCIRYGLRHGMITEDDLWGGDREVWDKLAAAADKDLKRQMELVSPRTHFVWDQSQPTFWVSTKLRTIDPDVLINGRASQLSDLDMAFARQRANYLQHKSGKWPMRVVA